MNALNKRYFFTNIKHYTALFAHRICKAFAQELYYESSSGVKVLNRKSERNNCEYEIRNVDPNQVRIFVDGLIDKYSLTNTLLLYSPHVDLVKKILNNQDITECDYVQREAYGRLDGRFECLVNSQTILQHISKCKEVEANFIKALIGRPKLVEVNNVYYALDGKHRLALAICKGKNIDCEVYKSEYIKSSAYLSKLTIKMQNSNKLYSKNLELLLNI